MQPSANELGSFMLLVGFLVGVGANLMMFLSSFRTQRRAVKMEENFATVSAVKEVESDLFSLKDQIVKNGEQRKEAIEAKVAKVREDLQGEITCLRDDISKVSAQVSGVQTETRLFNQSLARIDDKLDRLKEQIHAA